MRTLLRPHRGSFLLILGLLLAQSLMALINPWLAGRFASAMLAHSPVQGLLWLWLVLIGVQSLVAWISGVRLQATTATLVAEIGGKVFDHLQALPLAWHQDRAHGDVLSLLTQDVNRLGQFLVVSLVPLLPQLLVCVGALLMMFWIAPWFALAAAVLVPAVFLGMRLASRRLRPLGQQISQSFAAKSAIADQSLSMLPVIKAYVGEEIESERFREESLKLRDTQVTLARHSGVIAPLVRWFSAATILVLLSLASRDVAAGSLSPDALVSLLLYGLLLTQPVSALAGVYGQAQVARGSAQRLLELFDQAPEPDEGNLAPEQLRGELRFEHVCFAHPGRERVLDGLELAVQAGEVVAITGVNGAGKSTLIHLLMRFADPESGRILLDGRNLRDYRLASLRGHMGLVSQTVLLFDASVAENIAWGRPQATLGEIEAAARLAQAHEFILTLPEGYATRVGERGVKLSGGQQQRIALARALLKRPSILILDEATAMFDPEAERAFIRDCRERLHACTCLLNTHRPATLSLADRVLRLERGQLSSIGVP